MQTGSLKIHTENILPIIKKWLYSEKDIFIRELVSNACDALQKCKRLRECEVLKSTDDALRIDLTLDRVARTLTFSDTGVGMTGAEVESYIAQVAFSGAEEFVEKYQQGSEAIIGHFGLGFYSAYMVARLVTIDTLSYQEGAAPALWSCDGSATYTLDTGARQERGTTITLSLSEGEEEYLDEAKVRALLQKYCLFLPFPIYLNGKRCNEEAPLWLKSASACTESDYLAFYKKLYPLEPDPLFWVHLNVDYPFHVQGILYFPKMGASFDFNKNAIKLFCNRVFVSDSCKELVPDYLLALRGALDSSDIPLNVSRSTLQMDRTVRQLGSHIAKKVLDRLFALERDKRLAIWSDIELIIKLGMLQDETFCKRAQELLVWKTVQGEWLHLSERKGDTLFYTDVASSPLVSLYTEQGHTVIVTSTPLDTPLMALLEEKVEGLHFQRVDGALHDTVLDKSREKGLLDAEGRTFSARLASFIRSHLPVTDLKVEAKSLSHDATPAFLVIDEASRRLKESFALSRQTLPDALATRGRTFVVNTNHPLVQAIDTLQENLAGELTRHLYDLSLLAQKEMPTESLAPFIARSNQLLGTLLSTHQSPRPAPSPLPQDTPSP
jgi:molecular chaperone HtpG